MNVSARPDLVTCRDNMPSVTEEQCQLNVEQSAGSRGKDDHRKHGGSRTRRSIPIAQGLLFLRLVENNATVAGLLHDDQGRQRRSHQIAPACEPPDMAISMLNTTLCATR